ncbi:CxxxxCH/CxxCH domain-containing protein [bacterium]|nr:CxxxxCH/CxxCH domain-containing protein [bacterium]
MTRKLNRFFIGLGLLGWMLLWGFVPVGVALELTPEAPWCSDLTSPTRVECDITNHLVYVTCPRSGEIIVFDETGAVLDNIETLAHPTAIAADGAGYLFVADGQAVRKIADDGTPVLALGGSQTYFTRPHDVAIGLDGRIYVSDVTDTIKVFDASGTLVGAFGGYGWFNGRLDDPVALTIRTQGDVSELFVSDQNNGRIQVFNEDGDYLRSWGELGNGDYSPSEFLRGWGLAIDGNNRLWVFDAVLNALQVFSASGTFLEMFVLDESELRTGVDIAIDGDKLYLTSQSLHCVLVYTISEGEPVVVGSSLPFHLTICRVPEGIQLKWDDVADVEGYQVFRSSEPNFSKDKDNVENLGFVSGTTFLDRDVLESMHRCYYRVEVAPHYATTSSGEFPIIPEEWSDEDRRLFAHHAPHTVTYGVRCTNCHFSNFDYPNPVPAWWFGDHLCKSCHVETGKAPAMQNHATSGGTMYCNICHDPHEHQSQFKQYYIRTVIATPKNGDVMVEFDDATDFIHRSPSYDGICEVCHTQTAYHRNDGSGNPGHYIGRNCLDCHYHINGFLPAGGSCNSCHESPPPTAAHLVHVGIPEAGVGYGDLSITSDAADPATAYNFGCGNCHPASMSGHMNGTLDVEFYDTSLPPFSLKAKNPSTATYTPGGETFTDSRGFDYTLGTCSNIYCHSSGTAAPYRTYADADWGQATPYSCGTCHGEPPSYETQSIGGDGANSHYQYYEAWGFNWGHILDIHWFHDSTTVADNTSTVLNCNICHYATTTSNQNVGLDSGDGDCSNCHDAMTDPPFGNRGTITNMARHVSGESEIEFNPLPYRSAAQAGPIPTGWTRYSNYDETILSDYATYEPGTKTCSNVPCHILQTNVQWGVGYSCNACHQYIAGREHGEEGVRLDSDAQCVDCHPANIHASQ